MAILQVTDPGPNKINAIKVFRDATLCSLKEAKDVIEGVIGWDKDIPKDRIGRLETEFKALGVKWSWTGNVSDFRRLLEAAIAWKKQKPRPKFESDADQALLNLVTDLQREHAPETLEPRTVYDRLMEDD
jgi:hypothetical protein